MNNGACQNSVQFVAINKCSNDKCNAKTNEDNSGDLVDDMNIVRSELLAKLSGEQDLRYIRYKNEEQAAGERHYPVIDGKLYHRRGDHQPEGNDAGVEDIHKKAGEHCLYNISSPHLDYM